MGKAKVLNLGFKVFSEWAFSKDGEGAVGVGLDDLGKSLDGLLKTLALQQAAVGDEVSRHSRHCEAAIHRTCFF